MLAVNLAERADLVKAYVAELRLTFPVVVDRTGEVARTYGVRFTPTHFLVDRRGVVRAGGSGSQDWSAPAAHAAVRFLLQPPPDGVATPPAPGDRAGDAPTGHPERR